jgi:hypothetical protein
VPHSIVTSLLAVWPVELVVVLAALCVALLEPASARPSGDDAPGLDADQRPSDRFEATPGLDDAPASAESSGSRFTGSAQS